MRYYPTLLVCGLALVVLTGCPQAAVTEATDTIATVNTSAGEFTIRLELEKAPLSVATFVTHVDSGYYDQSLFWRVIPQELVQAGGYELGLVTKTAGDPIINESDNGLLNVRGTIAMARTSDPNSAAAQFFINVADNPDFDPSMGEPGYAVFGTVIDGMDVIDAIAALPTTTRNDFANAPEEDVIITAAESLGSNQVRMTTTLGTFTLQLDSANALVTVANFMDYVASGFYVGTLFHRVSADSFVQGGGVTLGPVASATQTPIANESTNDLANKRGRVALYYASDPNSVTPQFFVNVVDNPQFNASGDTLGFPVFGEVVDGMDVIDAIAALPTETIAGLENAPINDVVIQQITVSEEPAGYLVLTTYGEYYRDHAWYQTQVLIRNLLGTFITYGVVGN